MKKLLIPILVMAAVIAGYSADNVDEGKGVSRQLRVSRWTTYKSGADANTPWATTTITNNVTAASGVLGRIMFVPGALTDTLAVYNASHGTNATTALKIFETVPNSPTMANSTTFQSTLGQPLIYTFDEGLPYTSGLVIMHTRAATTTGVKSYITYDKYR